jgi:hypothetical protein
MLALSSAKQAKKRQETPSKQKGPVAMQGTLMIDATHDNIGNIPVSTPKVAGYITGTPSVKWTEQDWDCFPAAGKLRIDQSPSLASYAGNAASVADIEPGAGTISAYVEACHYRLRIGRLLWFYCDQATVGQVSAALQQASLPLGKCGVWLANWNLSQAEADAVLGTAIAGVRVVGVQWASPTSNPTTLVPGSGLTLAEANVDLSVTRPGWFESPALVLGAPQAIAVPVLAGAAG